MIEKELLQFPDIDLDINYDRERYNNVVSYFEQMEQKVINYVNSLDNGEDIEEIKVKRANLNKVIKYLGEQRKEVEEIWRKPYKVLEDKIKAIIDVYSNREKEYANIVNDNTNNYRESKKEKIVNYFSQKNSYGVLLSLDTFFNEKWLNYGYAMETIEEEIDNLIIKIDKDIKIMEKNVGYSVSLMNIMILKYFEILDLSEVFNEKEKIESKLQVLENIRDNETDITSISFVVNDSRENIYRVRDFMREKNINFQRIITDRKVA